MLFALLAIPLHAADAPQPVREHPSLRLFIDPSSTTVSLGKVSLTVSPLTHNGKVLLGDYQIKVVPYFYKNEKGALELEFSDEMEQKLLNGVAVKFSGKATNSKNGKVKEIVGKASPTANDRGNVTFSILTKNGLMVFNTTYHFGE